MSRLKNEYVKQLIGSIEDIADDLLDSDIFTAMKLRRIASNVALAFVDNDLLIENLDVDASSKQQITAMLKEVVSATRASKKKPTKRQKG